MSNSAVMGDLSYLLGSVNIDEKSKEERETSHDAILRLNSYLNNSLDLRNISPDPQRSGTLDAVWADLLNNNELASDFSLGSSKKTSPGLDVASSSGGSSLSRMLSQSYSLSSDSSGSPHHPLSKFSPQENCSSGQVFSYLDDGLQSGGPSHSRQSFSYSNSSGGPRNVSFSTSDPGSPTLDDALLMGCQSDSAFRSSSAASKIKDITVADLMNNLGLHNSYGSGTVGGRQVGINTMQMNRGSGSSRSLMGLGGQQYQCGGMQSFGGLQQTNTCNTTSQSQDAADLTQLQNAWLSAQLLTGIVDSNSGLGSDYRVTPSIPSVAGSDPFAIEKAAKLHRSAAAVTDATCTWSGHLPVTVHKNSVYSCKVFLGGVPWDVTEMALKQTFLHFGNIQVEWPGKENSANPPRGYVYILFENDKQVKMLLAACSQDFSFGGSYYFKISSRRMRQKEVQIIPWLISDSNYVRSPSYQLDPAKTVFVGALHGMLSAEGLANIMNDLFGGVVYSGIDTDKHKYPIGSGRVTFNNVQSYRKAVKAAFIEIKTPKFTKKVQVDPYLADSLCQHCSLQHGPYFCRDESCFKYYCRQCWLLAHPVYTHGQHKPLMRNSKLRVQTTLPRLV